MYEVYGLEDFKPYALACRSCTQHVLSVVSFAYANLSSDAPQACELFYDGICDEYPSNVSEDRSTLHHVIHDHDPRTNYGAW